MSTVLEAAPDIAAGWAGLPVALLELVRPGIVRVQGRGPAGASGVVWRLNAVVTNHHVVAGAGRSLRVLSADGRVHPARVLAASRALDLALLDLAGADLSPVPIGQSARLRVGELVFAVGHPWGQPWVVTVGVVSGLGALRVPGRGQPVDAIRSDVRLAPGNSGGPLLDARGDVVGLNAMVLGGDLVVVIGDEELLVTAGAASPSAGTRTIVALADDDRPARTLRGLPLRGWAIVSRDAPAAELRAAVMAAAQGLVVLPAALIARLLPAPVAGPGEGLGQLPEPLTPREREVLELLGEGLSNRRIAERLGVSEHTAKFHVAAVCGKLGASSRTEAVSLGVRRGLITL